MKVAECPGSTLIDAGVNVMDTALVSSTTGGNVARVVELLNTYAVAACEYSNVYVVAHDPLLKRRYGFIRKWDRP